MSSKQLKSCVSRRLILRAGITSLNEALSWRVLRIAQSLMLVNMTTQFVFKLRAIRGHVFR